MTKEELEENIEVILWDLWDLAKNPNNTTKYHSVADASVDLLALFKRNEEAPQTYKHTYLNKDEVTALYKMNP